MQGQIAQWSLNHHLSKQSKHPLLGLYPIGAAFPYKDVACGEPRDIWQESALFKRKFVLEFFYIMV